MYTLDTNAILYYVKGEEGVVKTVESIYEESAPVYISTITEVELFGFPLLSDDEEEKIETFLRSVSIINLDSSIARRAGEIRRMYRLKTPDSVVAATAMFTGSILVTRNITDFKRVEALKIQGI